MQQDSIFTKIIAGKIPAYKIYEDDKTLAFLDIHPVQPGHTLVIPKAQVDHLWDLPDDEYQHLLLVTKKVANHIRQQLRVARVGVQVVGLDVPHAHIHLIPFNTTPEFRLVPDPQAEPDHAALTQMAKKLAEKGVI